MSIENIANSSELALLDYQMAVELEPDSEEIYFGLVEMYANAGDIKAAINMLKEGIGEKYAENNEDYLEVMNQVTTFCLGDNFVQPEELTINGIPFSESTIQDAMTAYPSDGNVVSEPITVDDEVVYDVWHSADGKESSTTKFIQKSDKDTLSSVSYSKIPYGYSIPYDGNGTIKIDNPEVRTIQIGDTQRDVLQKLGFTEPGIDYIINDLMVGGFRWDGNKWAIRQGDKDAILPDLEMYSAVSQIVISWTDVYLVLMFDEAGLCRVDYKVH